MTLPVQQLTVIAKKKQALVVIDGAHAPGVLDLDMRALSGAGADVYTGELTALLYDSLWYRILLLLLLRQGTATNGCLHRRGRPFCGSASPSRARSSLSQA